MEQPLDLNTDNGLTLNREGIAALKTSAKWARFVAIFGFVICGLLLISSLFGIGSLFGMYGGGGAIYFIVYFSILTMACFWVLFFAQNALNAIRYNDNLKLTSSLRYLRNLFILQGIAVILMLLVFLGAIAFALMYAGSLRF